MKNEYALEQQLLSVPVIVVVLAVYNMIQKFANSHAVVNVISPLIAS